MDLEQFAVGAHTAPPMRLGQRHDAERFLPDPGNTVVCHLDMDTDGAAAVLRARARIKALPGAEHVLFTPENSLHMTVFEGVLDVRRTPDAWPSFMEADASVDAVTDAMRGRLAGLEGPEFAVRVKALRPGGLELVGATDADVAALFAWREALSGAFCYRQGAHDAYKHHLTFGYAVSWLPDALVPAWRAALAEIEAELVAAAPVIPLRAPAFCEFADMTWFEELVRLG